MAFFFFPFQVKKDERSDSDETDDDIDNQLDKNK